MAVRLRPGGLPVSRRRPARCGGADVMADHGSELDEFVTASVGLALGAFGAGPQVRVQFVAVTDGRQRGIRPASCLSGFLWSGHCSGC